MRIAIDAMGGDFGPGVTVPGSLDALQLNPDLEIILTGVKDKIEEALDRHRQPSVRQELGWLFKHKSQPRGRWRNFGRIHPLPDLRERITIEHAPSFVPMDAAGFGLLRHVSKDTKAKGVLKPEDVKPDTQFETSIAQAGKLLRLGKADAVLSAGNSAAAPLILEKLIGMIEGVGSAALMATFPTEKKGEFVALADAGVVIERDAFQIVEAGVLAGVFAQHSFGLENGARHAVFGFGDQEGKAKQSALMAAKIFKQLHAEGLLNYVGIREPKHVFAHEMDAIATSGDDGNNTTKTAPAAGNAAANKEREEIFGDRWTMPFNVVLNYRKWKRRKHWATSEGRNAAGLYSGLNGAVFKSHGDVNAEKFCAGILEAHRLASTDIMNKLRHDVPRIMKRAREIYESMR